MIDQIKLKIFPIIPPKLLDVFVPKGSLKAYLMTTPSQNPHIKFCGWNGSKSKMLKTPPPIFGAHHPKLPLF